MAATAIHHVKAGSNKYNPGPGQLLAQGSTSQLPMSSGKLLPPAEQHGLVSSSHSITCLHGILHDSNTSTSAGVGALQHHVC